jgi:Arc/MetJ-type ribon-helix-helix transcriptional regulator
MVLPDNLQSLVHSIYTQGAYEDEAAVIGEALQLLKRRDDFRAGLAEGIAQLDRGESTEYGEGDLERFRNDIRIAAQNLSPEFEKPME